MADDSSGRFTYDAELRTVAKGGGLGLLGKLGNQTLALIAGPVTARLIGPAAYGLIQLSASLNDLLQVLLSFGLSMSITKFVSIYESEGRRDLSRGAVAGALAICVGAAAGVALAVAVYPEFVTERIYDKPQWGPVLQLMILILPLGVAAGLMIPATIARRTIVYRMLTDLLLRPITLAGVLVFCGALGLGAQGAAGAYLIAKTIGAGVAFAGVRRLIGRLTPHDVRNFEGRRLMSVALPLLLTQLARFGLFRVNNLIGGRWLTDKELGQYSAASRLATSGLVGKITIGAMFAPIISSLHHQGRRDELQRMFETTTRWGHYLALPAMMIAIAKAPSAMHLFGREFVDAGPALQVLAMGQIVNTSVGPLPALIGMADLHWLSALNNALAACVNIALCVLLTPRMRVLGLATAGAVAATAVNTLRVIEAFFLLRISPYAWRAVKPVFAAALAGPVLYFVRFESWAVDLVVPSVIFVLVYMLLVRLIGLDSDDNDVLDALKKRLLRLRIRAAKD
ncbi:MAG: polysaccharide biosynthesis protein [Armatimonadetes bacterium]|nr:polysaccharide biosynthesis protein [Armatimonadota bacterium]